MPDNNGNGFSTSSYAATMGIPPAWDSRTPRKPKVRPPRGPDSGFPILPVDTFSSRYNVVNQNYYIYFDEALRDSRENTLVMRRDGFVHELLRHRQYPIISLPQHVEVDDPDDEGQKAVSEILDKIICSVPRIKTLKLTLLEGIFYGQYGVMLKYGNKKISGKNYTSIVDFVPVNGDKIRYKWDGTPGIAVRAGAYTPDPTNPGNGTLVHYRDYIEYAMNGPALFLKDDYLRDRFIIHKFEPSDTDYIFEADEAQSAIGGVGLRSRLYWVWNIRTEILSWVIDALQRVGANGMIYGFYPEGNANAQAAMLTALQMLVKDNISVFPIVQGSPQKPFERIEPASVGYDTMIRIIEHLEGIMRRATLGQDLSSKAMATGMGSSTGQLQGAVRADYISYDASCLSDTLTEQLLSPILKYNWFEYEGRIWRGSDLPFSSRIVIQVEDENIKDAIDAAVKLAGIGVEMSQSDLQAKSGLAPPKDEADKIGGKEFLSQDQFKGSVPGLDGASDEIKKFVSYIAERGEKLGLLKKSHIASPV